MTSEVSSSLSVTTALANEPLPVGSLQLVARLLRQDSQLGSSAPGHP
jgi:hypothetical protein